MPRPATFSAALATNLSRGSEPTIVTSGRGGPALSKSLRSGAFPTAPRRLPFGGKTAAAAARFSWRGGIPPAESVVRLVKQRGGGLRERGGREMGAPLCYITSQVVRGRG